MGEAKGLMVWGPFDAFIVRIIPAKELRAQVRQKGVVGEDRAYKAWLLRRTIDRLLRDAGSQTTEVPIRSPSIGEVKRGPGRRHAPLSTCTVTPGGRVVPWLAADGPLAYTPEKPPDRDYYFQYGWVLPGIFAEHRNTRRHFYFGASRKDDASELFRFWETARSGDVERVAHILGSVSAEEVMAPVAAYRTVQALGDDAYVLIQHGSYQIVPIGDQPLLERGEVVLYRGVQKSRQFRFLDAGATGSAERSTWRRYVQVQAHVLSDAARSFNSNHDRTKRCETGHIRDQT